MKLSVQTLRGLAIVTILFSLQARAGDAAPSSPRSPALRQAAAGVTGPSVTGPLGSGTRQNVQIALAGTTALDLQRGSSRGIYGDIQASPIVAEQNRAGNEQIPVSAAEPASEIWMFVGGLAIAFVIAWRRCQWANLRSASVISPGSRSPQQPPVPDKHSPSPIGLAADHGHLPFGG